MKFYLLLFLFLISGCNSVIETVKNPSDLWRFDTLKLHIETNELLNVASNNSSRSTVFRIYQLKNKKNIESFEYDDWLSFDKTNNNVLKLDQNTVKSNDTKEIKSHILRETKFVSIVFFFNQLDENKDNWRKIFSIDELEQYGVLNLKINDKTIIITNIEGE